MKRSSRLVKPNSKYSDSNESFSSGPKRACSKSGCPAKVPICFARVADRCLGSGWTSRWYHLTVGEHFCNECFEYFYRSHKEGYNQYSEWKLEWSAKARIEATVSLYFVEEILPYWVQCADCQKWRQLSREAHLTPDFINTFCCASMPGAHTDLKKSKVDRCSMPEDERVNFVHSSQWLVQNVHTPYFKNCPSASFLTAYYADGVGLSPTENNEPVTKDKKGESCPFVNPFLQGDALMHAFGVTPDMMLEKEIESFPVFAQECPHMYLAIRNLVLALWALNPKEWLTKQKCMCHLICRGLARVSCVSYLDSVLAYLTDNSFINVGLVSPPPTVRDRFNTQGISVIVIGAGISGLAAAYRLHSFGFKVKILEAKDRIGGRIHGIDVLPGKSISLSGEILHGCMNNPIAILAYQAGLDVLPETDHCKLITSKGNLVSDSVDRRIEFHYNAILDIIAEWRKNKTIHQDMNLEDKFTEFHREFVSQTQENFSSEDLQVVNFHLSNLEYVCGSSLSKVSSLYWDQNENKPQFLGDPGAVAGGMKAGLHRLADQLDIQLNTQVSSIDFSGKFIIVKSTTTEYTADKVIITLPLSILASEKIKFNPPLPENKVSAIKALGIGQVEKVVLHFQEDFWSDKTGDHKMFGHVPVGQSERGLFNVFYVNFMGQVSSNKAHYILSSYLVGEALTSRQNKQDEEIIADCLQVLGSLFPEKPIPQPTQSYVSHWRTDPHIGMSYCYIPVGTMPEVFDHMEETVEGKLFFAGEATQGQFPQTVSGAYLSGVREACKVAASLERS